MGWAMDHNDPNGPMLIESGNEKKSIRKNKGQSWTSTLTQMSDASPDFTK